MKGPQPVTTERAVTPGLTPGGSATPPPGARIQALRDAETEERYQNLRSAVLIGVFAWPAFYAVDLFAALAVTPPASLGWLTLWRAIGCVSILGFHLFVRGHRRLGGAGLLAVEMAFFGIPATLVSLMALRHGGLTSTYVNGIGIITMVQAVTMTSRWQRAMATTSVTALIYPAVMGIAAGFDAEVRRAWASPAVLASFIHQYTFVAATVIMCGIASHLVWAARRQVFEARRLGRYRLKSRIGAGGMGEVWLARDDALRREVALKILDTRASGLAGARARFEREALAASSLHSPHTIRVFDYGASDDGVAYIAMELLHGEDMAALVGREGPLDPARCARLGRQVCASLAEAHARGIIHRDVKPENLFVTRGEDGTEIVKVLDFGIAKVSDASLDATLTQGGWVGGTPAYMAPEVCAGGAADARSDIYSLGAVLYFMLTGAPPFAEANPGGVMMAHVRQQVAPPSRRAPRPVPPPLEAAILRCLAKRPKDRFAGAHELDEALARIA